MEAELKIIYAATEDHMKKAIGHLEATLLKFRVGKANPALLEGIHVNYYGAKTPLSQVANINTLDVKTLVIQPWDKSVIRDIEKAILEANIGITPVVDKEVIRLGFPPLTEERRKDLVKQAKHEAENTRVSIRNIRRDAVEQVRKLVKSGLPKDMEKTAETTIQKMTDGYIVKVDKHLEIKEKEILTV